MRAIYFMMIDYIKTRQQMYFLPVFFVIAAALWGQGDLVLIPLSYMVFIAVIYATSPFGACKKGDAGFLVLLPSTTTHRVLGRFLYGISFVGIAVVSGGIFMAVHQLTGREIELWVIGGCLFLLAFCIFIITLEFLILYLAGEHMAPQILGIVRTAPAMGGFFAMMYLMDDIEAAGPGNISMIQDAGGALIKMGFIAIGAVLVLLAAAIVICVKVTAKRDYV